MNHTKTQPMLAVTASGEPLSFLRLPEVKSRTSLSSSEIYRRIGANPSTFPAPVKLGERASAWLSSDIDRWIADRIAERDAKAAA